METILSSLRAADAALDRISVRGGDTYLLLQARALLKRAYDACEAYGKGAEEHAS